MESTGVAKGDSRVARAALHCAFLFAWSHSIHTSHQASIKLQGSSAFESCHHVMWFQSLSGHVFYGFSVFGRSASILRERSIFLDSKAFFITFSLEACVMFRSDYSRIATTTHNATTSTTLFAEKVLQVQPAHVSDSVAHHTHTHNFPQEDNDAAHDQL